MKILVRAPNWIGDAIMAIPALRALRACSPAANLSILARPPVLDIYRDQDLADDLVAYDWRGIHAGIAGRERLATDIRARRYDTAILLQNAFDAAWLAWRAKIPQRIGYNRDARGFFLTKAIAIPKIGEIPAHEKYYYLELLRRAACIQSLPEESFIRLTVSDEKRRQASAFLQQAGARRGATRIAIGAGASYGSAKCWPPERFAQLANQLQSQSEAEVILFGTAAESPVSNAIVAGMSRPPIDLTGKTSVADLPALLSHCHIFIGNDSGAMHVAAAVGLPVVAIFGPTDPHGTAPVTPRCAIVQEKPFCSPCFLRRCPIDHRCMTKISAEAVHSAAQPWLAGIEVHRG